MRLGIGIGLNNFRKTGTGGSGPIISAPSQFTAGQWTLTDSPSAGGDKLLLDMLELPYDGGSPLTALQYRVGGGSAQTLSGLATGARLITVLASTAAAVEVRAVNAIGSAAWSDVKTVTPTVTATPTLPTTQTARFGAKTLTGVGTWRPMMTDGTGVDLASYVGLVSGSLGSYVPSISGAGLRFTGGGAGAPNGAVVQVMTTGGATITATISTIANEYSVASLTEARAAYSACALGDYIRLRANSHNPTGARVLVSRTSAPTGTWTGTAALSDGNWVVLTRDPDAVVTIGAMEISGGGGSHARYLRVHDLDIVSPFNGDGNGLGTGDSTGVSAQLYLNGGSHVAVTNCRLRHVSTTLGTTDGLMRAITWGNGSPTDVDEARWIEGNTINGARHGFFGSARASIVRGNTLKRVLSDAMQISHCSGLLIEGNTITDKLYGYTPLTPTAITRGTSTIVTVADTSSATVGEPAAFSGFAGAFGASINGQLAAISAKTATTLTISIDSSGYAAWDGVSGTVQAAASLHGDMIQFNDNLGAIATQNNVTVRGNLIYRGAADDSLMPDGQGIFSSSNGTTADRDGWLIEGNIYVGTFQNGIRVQKITNAIIRSNTIVRQLGIDASNGGSIPTISVEAGSSAALYDNIANAYVKTGTITADLGNATISLIASDAFPANSTDVASYAAAFSAPVTVPNTAFNPTTAFATRMDGGSVFTGPIYHGATPYFNYTTNVYTNPRAVSAVPFQVANADGWTVTYASPPTFTTPQSFSVTRQGYNAAAAAVSVVDTVYCTGRLRNPYPSQATLTSDRVVLSDYIYTPDTVSGATNSSGRAYPKPCALWLEHDYFEVIDSTFSVNLVVAHKHARNGRPVAAVKIKATDGTTTRETLVTSLTFNSYNTGLGTDAFRATFTSADFAVGAAITVSATIYPWVGAAYDLATDGNAAPHMASTVIRGYRVTPVYAYLSATGNNATAVASTNAATAAASPYLTIAAAAAGVQAFNNANYGRNEAGGGVLRFPVGTWVLDNTGSGAIPVTTACLVYEAISSADKATTILADAGSTRSTAMIAPRALVRNVTLKKMGANTTIFRSTDVSTTTLAFQNCNVDANGQTVYDAWVNRVGRMWMTNVAETNGATAFADVFGTLIKNVVAIGCRTDSNAAAISVIASRHSGLNLVYKVNISLGRRFGIVQNNVISGSTALFRVYIDGTDLSTPGGGMAFIGNVVEAWGSGAGAVRAWGDGNTQAVYDFIFANNTLPGASDDTRFNRLYSDVAGATMNKDMMMSFNVMGRSASKSDVFATDGTSIGNWPTAMSVSHSYNSYIEGRTPTDSYTGAGSWRFEIEPIGAQIGDGSTGVLNPLWVSDASKTGTNLGGGDYRPQSGSPLIKVPAGKTITARDALGKTIPTDGTAFVGALQT